MIKKHKIHQTYTFWYPFGLFTVINFFFYLENYFDSWYIKIAIGIISFLLLYNPLQIIWQLYKQKKWIKQDAIVLYFEKKTEVFLDRWMKIHIDYPYLKYSYTVNGNKYHADKYSLLENDFRMSSNYYEDKNIVLNHDTVPGKIISIWINPENPEKSVVSLGIHSDSLLKITIVIFLSIINLILVSV